jgi:hypothetical protein
MIVESMNDQEFAEEVVRDFFGEMMDYIERAKSQKGRIKKKHSSNYTSKRGNKWHLIHSSMEGGQVGMYIKRIQPKGWFTWYSLIFAANQITLFGFNKHVAQRISERYNPELSPTEALMEMLMKTPAIIQSEVGDSFYTRVNGGICLGAVYGKRFLINHGAYRIVVNLRETKTFVSDDMLFDNQKNVTDESIALAIERLGRSFLSDDDFSDLSGC